MSTGTRSQKLHAFTLLEVILALGIMSILAVALYGALAVSFKAKRGAEASLDAIREGEAAMELIRAELESALPPRGFTADAFTGRAWLGGNGAGRTYDLTGPEALSFAEIAATITEATGRKVSFYDETLDEAYASRASYGAPDWQVDAWVSTYTSVASGALAGVSTAVPELTGRPATSLAELLRR